MPIRGVKEYRFVYGDNAPGVGQGGDGEPKPGQMYWSRAKSGKGGQQAGDRPGVDYYETDVTLDELIDMMFEDLELPDMERKTAAPDRGRAPVSSTKGFRRKGIRVRLDKKRTARLARQAQEGRRSRRRPGRSRRRRRFPFHEDDLRYHHTDHRHAQRVQRRRALHHGHFRLHGHDEEISGAQFLLPALSVPLHALSKRRDRLHRAPHRGPRGDRGRILSQGRVRRHFHLFRLQQGAGDHPGALPPDLWNVYAFHCSDGDNFESDNAAALKAAKELAQISNLFGYGEIKPLGSGYYGSSMINFFPQIQEAEFPDRADPAQRRYLASFKTFLSQGPRSAKTPAVSADSMSR